MHRLLQLVVIACGIGVLSLQERGARASNRPLPRYAFVTLDAPLENAHYFRPDSISNSGDIVGALERPFGKLPASRNVDGHINVLKSLRSDRPGGEAFARNDHGQIVGYSNDRGNEAVLWQPDGSVVDLDAIAEAQGKNFFYAYDINIAGEVVGDGTSLVRGESVTRGLIWSAADGLRDVGALPGMSTSVAIAINDHGVVVGQSRSLGRPRAFMWTRATGLSELTGLKDADGGSLVSAINNAGQVAGELTERIGSSPIATTRPVRWEADGTMREIGFLDASDRSDLIGPVFSTYSNMNGLGQVIGDNRASTSSNREYSRHFLWDDEWGLLWLEKLIDSSGDDWRILGITDINDLGQIVGWAINSNEVTTGFLLNPVPEPTSSQMAFVAALASACIRRGRKRWSRSRATRGNGK